MPASKSRYMYGERYWIVRDNTDQAHGQLRVDDEIESCVTFIVHGQSPDNPCPEGAREDAALISAAPEMLRALQWVRLAVRSGMPPEAWPKSTMEKVEDAIRKATTIPEPPPVPVECRTYRSDD